MALYEVRSMNVDPGQFDSALVIAGGTLQARKTVAHMVEGDIKRLVAKRVDVAGTNAGVLTAYWDERTPASDPGGTTPLF